MFYIIYNTSSKYIREARNDTSVPVITPIQSRLAEFAKSNKLNATDFSVVELPYDEDLVVCLGRDMFDAATNTVYPDPNWVAPAPETMETVA